MQNICRGHNHRYTEVYPNRPQCQTVKLKCTTHIFALSIGLEGKEL